MTDQKFLGKSMRNFDELHMIRNYVNIISNFSFKKFGLV